MASAFVGARATQAQDSTEGVESIEEIVVRGEKVERTVQETLSSVSVTTGEAIRENGDTILSDILDRTPGTFVGSSGQAFSIRGVPLGGVSNFTEADVFSVYVDGAVQSNRNVIFNPFGLWDVDQVEVYRSSQSTVQGRNAQFGSIVVETRDPTYEPTVAGRVNYGSFNTWGVSGTVGGSIIPEMLAWRLSVDEQRSDGWVRNEGRGDPGDESRSNNTRAKLLFQPTEALSALLTLAHSETRQGSLNVDRVQRDPFRRKIFNNVDSFSEAGQDSSILELSYDLGERWTLVSESTYARNRLQSVLDFDGLPGSVPDPTLQKRLEHTYSQEVRLGFDDGDTLRGQISAYYFRLREDVNRGASLRLEDQFAGLVAPLVGADPDAFAGRVLAAYADGFRLDQRFVDDRDVANRAFFGELDWEFAPGWELTLGARYDAERRRNRPASVRDTTSPNGVDPVLDQILGMASDLILVEEPERAESARYRAFLPKLGLSYQPTENVRFGFLAQRGYRAGGTSLNLATGAVVEFDPEYSESYELSLRSTWLESRLDVNANVYYIDYEDQQVEALTNPLDEFSAQVSNAGESELFGVELDAGFAVTDALRLSGSAAVSRSVYREFRTDFLVLDGEQFEDAPKLKLTAGARYEIGDAWLLSANATYQARSVGEYLVDDFGVPFDEIKNDAYFTVNLALRYRFSQKGSVLLNVRNLFNDEYIEKNRQDTSVLLGEPRFLGISLQYEL